MHVSKAHRCVPAVWRWWWTLHGLLPDGDLQHRRTDQFCWLMTDHLQLNSIHFASREVGIDGQESSEGFGQVIEAMCQHPYCGTCGFCKSASADFDPERELLDYQCMCIQCARAMNRPGGCPFTCLPAVGRWSLHCHFLTFCPIWEMGNTGAAHVARPSMGNPSRHAAQLA